jgi:periplasmic protein TonB
LRAVPAVNVAGALFVTALEIALFAFGMKRVPLPTTLSPIAVRLVPLPARPEPVPAEAMPTIEPAPETMPPPPPRPPVETKLPAAPEPPPPQLQPQPRPTIETPPAETPPSTPEPPSPKPLRRAAHRPPQPQPPAPTSLPRAETPAPAPPRTPSASPPGGGTMGARALYKPMPEIPEELRHRNIALLAKARFHVARDGGVQVELIQATPLPALNRALIAALMTWRFFPALENGKPVASTIEINIPIEVK